MDNKRGEFLKKLRKDKKMTQQQLGNLLNYSDKNISKWENGISFPTDPETIKRLSEIFDVSFEEILYGDFKCESNYSEITSNSFEIYKTNYKEKEKIKNILFISFLSLSLIIIVLLISIYFMFIKSSIHSYRLIGTSDNIVSVEFYLMTSKKMSILNFYKIQSQKNIDYIYLCNKNCENIIFSGENDNYYIEEFKGSNEYRLSEIPNQEMYIKILFSDNTEELIRLSIEERFVNDRILIPKLSNENGVLSEKRKMTILEEYGFVYEKDYYKKFYKNISITFYIDKFEVNIKNGECIKKISKNIYSDDIIYEKISNDSYDIKKLKIDGTCNCDEKICYGFQDLGMYLNFLTSLININD